MTTEAELRKLAEGQSAAYVQLLERGEGVGGLDTDKFDAMIAWDDASENGHADVVLGLLDKLDEARAVIKILERRIHADSRAERMRADEVERMAYLITAFRFKERGLRGAIREPDISIARPMAEFLSREGYRLTTEVFILDGELARDAAHHDPLPLPRAFRTQEAAEAYVQSQMPLNGSHTIQRVPSHRDGGTK